jgi:hypothetical protein
MTISQLEGTNYTLTTLLNQIEIHNNEHIRDMSIANAYTLL